MAKVLGRKISVGLSKEAVRGTAVAPTYWMPVTSIDHDQKVEYIQEDSGFGTIHNKTNSTIGKVWGEGGFGGPIYDKGFGLLLYNLLGTVNSAVKETTAYTHTFTVQEGVNHQSLTVSFDDAIQDYAYSLGMITDMEINYELGKIVEYKAGFLSKDGETATLTPAYAAENHFRPKDFELKIAATTADFAGATPETIRSMKLKVTKNVDPDQILGSVEPRDFVNKNLEISGEFTMVYENGTLRGYSVAGTKKAMQIKLTNADVTIGATSNPELKIILNQVAFDDYSREKSLNDLVLVTYAFTGEYKMADSKAIQIELTNVVVSY